MLLGQELKFKNKLCNLKLGTFFSALPGLGASALSGRVGLTCETSVGNTMMDMCCCDEVKGEGYILNLILYSLFRVFPIFDPRVSFHFFPCRAYI